MMGRTTGSGALCATSEHHDKMIIDNINQMVGRDDELFIIGDFAFDKPGKYRAMIDCKHIKFIMGNHDRKQKSSNVFGETPDILRTKCFNKDGTEYFDMYMCHYPTMYWDQSHNGACHLYGHCHGQREEYLDSLEPGRRALDVGVDNAMKLLGEFRPFADYEVYDYMARRSGHDDVRFYKDYQRELFLNRGLYNLHKENVPNRKRGF